ncbi:MAG: hypothetical protein ABSD44_11760 [Terracidiphilus sp.]|jgi:hypothetical protein
MTGFQGLNEKLLSLGFQGSGSMRLVIGRVTITGGPSPRGFSFMFTEGSARSMTQYEVSGPLSATAETMRNLIRANLMLNHASSVEEWDTLQFNLEKSGQNR